MQLLRSPSPLEQLPIETCAGATRARLAFVIHCSIHSCLSLLVRVLTVLQAQPQLVSSGFQVVVVDYSDERTLTFALRGVDTVISTVPGPNQSELIKAAISARARRFAPAEFEGLPDLRRPDCPLDRGRCAARQLLAHYSRYIESTRFVCGILYERFQPGGLRQTHMGRASGFSGEGDYIADCRNMTAQVPVYDSNNNSNVTICLTAARDVGRFVSRAIDLEEWPAEMTMCGQRILVKDFVALLQRLRGLSQITCTTKEFHLLTILQDAHSTQFNGTIQPPYARRFAWLQHNEISPRAYACTRFWQRWKATTTTRTSI